jgi:hypothetical protein
MKLSDELFRTERERAAKQRALAHVERNRRRRAFWHWLSAGIRGIFR